MTMIGQIQWSIRSKEGTTEIAEFENTNDIISEKLTIASTYFQKLTFIPMVVTKSVPKSQPNPPARAKDRSKTTEATPQARDEDLSMARAMSVDEIGSV